VKKGIAFFDFDGTITTKDTLLEFIKYSKGVMHFYVGFLLNSPYLLAYKLKIISNQSAKEKILRFFFAKMSVGAFNEICDDFAANGIPQLIRPKALEEIEKFKNNGTRVVIVSASPENWISKWSAAIQADLIATQLEVKNELLTGNIIGKNCHGEEKVRRIKSKYDLSRYDSIYAYGDSGGDKPMLALASRAYYKPFR
jgi:HAD superfamily hydrolase (TIGR01490 family)